MDYPKDTRREQTVLIVDDGPENVALVGSMLRGVCQTRLAGTGEEALEIAFSDKPPDLILLDIMMPGMDGYEVCRRLKADDRTSDIPVIFLTAKTRVEEERIGFDLGAVDYIAKPVSAPIVLARVKTHLDLQCQKRQLQENYVQLRKLEQLRDSLVHMMVHDLRTPLTSVIGYLELLKEFETDNWTEEGKELVEIAYRSAETLVEMISAVLDVSRMESMKMKLNLTECDLTEIAEKAVAKLAPFRKGTQVDLKAPPYPVRATADPDLIARVIQNLLGNAIKFASQSVEAKVVIESGDDFVRVSVSDNGPGIPPEYHERIFEKFGQVEARQQGRKFSTGLGLTFCKLSVEAHGGRIGVESAIGRGSTFWFELPASGPQDT